MDVCYLLPIEYETDRTYAHEVDEIKYVYYNLTEHANADYTVFYDVSTANTGNEGIVFATGGLPSPQELYDRIVGPPATAAVRALTVVFQSWPARSSKRRLLEVLERVFTDIVPEDEFLLVDTPQNSQAEPCTAGYWCIKIWASPNNATQSGYNDSLIESLNTGALANDVFDYVPSENSHPVIIEDIILGQVIGKSIFIHYNVLRNTDSLTLFETVLKEALDVCNGKRYDLEEMIVSRLEMLMGNFLHVKQTQLEDVLRAIGELVGTLSRKHKQRADLMINIEAYSHGEAHERIRREVRLIRKNENVTDFSVVGDSMMFSTNMMSFIVDGEKYNVGCFDVAVNLLTSNVRFANTTQLISGGYQRRMHAPHVFSNGEACFGNISVSVTELISNGELASVVDLLCAFLSSVNTSDAAGKYYDLWPLAGDE